MKIWAKGRRPLQKQWPRKIQGSLRVELTGPALERFINDALNRGIHISRIVWLSRNRIRLTLSVGGLLSVKTCIKGNQDQVTDT